MNTRPFTLVMAFIAMIRRDGHEYGRSTTYQRREVVIGAPFLYLPAEEIAPFESETLNAIRLAQSKGRDPGPFPVVSYRVADGNPITVRSQGEAAPDLAVALAVDAHARRQPMHAGLVPMAGLDCNGNTRPLRGVYGRLRALPPDPNRAIIVNRQNAGEAIDANRGVVYVASTLVDAREIARLHARRDSLTEDEARRGLTWPATREARAVTAKRAEEDARPEVDFADLHGDEIGAAAREIARAVREVGRTVHIKFIAPPGAGAVAISRRITGLLPPMTDAEVDHGREVYSRAGNYPRGTIRRPFRAPHHTCSSRGLRGEVELSSAGVLLLDEAPEFHRVAMESAYQAIKESDVPPAVVVRVQCPCPCGFDGVSSGRQCVCQPAAIDRYNRRADHQAPPADLVIRLTTNPLLVSIGEGPRCPSTAEIVKTAAAGAE